MRYSRAPCRAVPYMVPPRERPRKAPEQSLTARSVHDEASPHSEHGVRITLEVVGAWIHARRHVVRLTRELQELARRRRKSAYAGVRIGDEVHVVHANFQREANDVATIRVDLLRLEVVPLPVADHRHFDGFSA